MRFIAICTLLLGCPRDPVVSCDEAAEETPSAEIGTGEVHFESIDEGQQLMFIQGAQGGFHIPGSVRAHGLLSGNLDNYYDESNPTITWTVDVTDTDSLGGSMGPRPLKVRSDGTLEAVGDIVPLYIGSRDDAIGVEVTFGVEITDDCGTTVSDERDVVLTAG